MNTSFNCKCRLQQVDSKLEPAIAWMIENCICTYHNYKTENSKGYRYSFFLYIFILFNFSLLTILKLNWLLHFS